VDAVYAPNRREIMRYARTDVLLIAWDRAADESIVTRVRRASNMLERSLWTATD
jgi:hypothetical protein